MNVNACILLNYLEGYAEVERSTFHFIIIQFSGSPELVNYFIQNLHTFKKMYGTAEISRDFRVDSLFILVHNCGKNKPLYA